MTDKDRDGWAGKMDGWMQLAAAIVKSGTMKKAFLLHAVLMAAVVAFAPAGLSAKAVSSGDYTVTDCQLPDGTVCDITLFKSESKFKQDMQAHIGEQTKNDSALFNEVRIFKNYRKLRNLTWEERKAWKKSQQPVEDDLYFITSCSAGECGLLGVMKSNKMPFGSAYTEEDGRIRVVIATADKKYASLTFEKFYLVERTSENADGAPIEKVTLPDGTVTDLVVVLRDRDIETYYMSYMAENTKLDPLALVAQASREAHNYSHNIPDETESWAWERVYTPTKKDWERARSNGGSIIAPGYVRREYELEKMGELGLFMKENEIPAAVIFNETGDKKRQEIVIFMGMNWERFICQKIDYVYRKKKN